jgi:hypothetical protein
MLASGNHSTLEEWMNVDIALFFHICGVLVLFVSAALEIMSLTQLRRTRTVEVARAWASVNKPLEFSFPISVLILIPSGLYMLHENPDFKQAQPWALTVLVVLIVLAILGGAFNGRRMQAILDGLQEAPEGPVPADIQVRINDPALLTSIQAMTGAILGAILIMTVKPGLRDSIIIAAVSLILGGLSAQLVLRNRTSPQTAVAVVAASGGSADSRE